jgi:hypothetical protein
MQYTHSSDISTEANNNNNRQHLVETSSPYITIKGIERRHHKVSPLMLNHVLVITVASHIQEATLMCVMQKGKNATNATSLVTSRKYVVPLQSIHSKSKRTQTRSFFKAS